MDNALLRVLLFCLSEDREYISLQRQGLNIFGVLSVGGLSQFIALVSLHICSLISMAKLSEFIPVVSRLNFGSWVIRIHPLGKLYR
jgi:hypothetical protein